MKTQLFTEIWKDIPCYIGLYQASTFGRIRSLDHYVKQYNRWGQLVERIQKGRIFKLKTDKDGYKEVQLHKDGNKKYYRVHRLIYLTFKGKLSDDLVINHINEIKWDNSVWNLELVTPKENRNYGKCIEKTSKKIGQYDKLTDQLIKIWKSSVECDKHGFKKGSIWNCCHNKQKTAYGFKWKLL